MRLKWKLTVASFKMYFREREAIVWTFIFPLMVVVLFSFMRFDGLGRVDLGIVDESGGKGKGLVEELRGVKTLSITEGSRSEEMAMLEKGERDMVLLVPSTFIPAGERLDSAGSPRAPALLAYTNDERVQESQLGSLLVQRVLDEMALARDSSLFRTSLRTEPVKSRNLTYIDFLLPGVLGMSIMQMGIFGVAFGFVSLKKRGILRRLSVAPIHPADFITGQVAMRVVVLMLQIVLMVAVGIFFLHFHFVGSLLSMFVLGALGAVVFLGFGFALAGISSTENQVAPLANLITLPMMLLSGVFFNRAHLPGLLRTVTEFLPLTYLADGLRAIAVNGASLVDAWPQVLGLAVWSVIAVGLAVKAFRWE